MKSNAKRYSGYWDWNIVFGRLLTDENKDDINSLDKFANLISNIEDKEKCEKAWAAFTKQFSFKDLLVLIPETQSKGFYLWNLADFCTRKEFDVFTYLEKYRNFIDWEALSSSENVNEQFKYSIDSGITHKKWNDKVLNVLTNIKNKWDFMKLSHLSSLCANYGFLSKFKDRIDWEYISQYSSYFAVGNDRESLRKRILPYREYISFDLLSLRNDIDTTTLIHLFPKEEYNYNALIAKGEYKVTQEDIEIYHPYYKWDWRLVSESESFVPTANFMLSHIDENINWRNLSKRGIQSLWSSEAIIVNVAQKSNICKDIDWYKLSSLQYFPITKPVFLNIPLSKLNWEILSARKGIGKLIDLCEIYIDWTVLSNNKDFDAQDLDSIGKYKNKLNWSVICQRKDFHINNNILEKFSEYIDWNAASASEDIEFSKQLVEKFENRWNWPILIKNKACFNRVKLQDFSEAKNENIIQFINCFSNRHPKAYHFTHMSNAIKIIQSRKIMSRNLAKGCFDNSAGAGVITRTNKAHRFARFYYRPGTPTQFYNEFLGKDHTLEYYNSAVRLGLPKCPMPVFFVFDIEEIVSTFPNLCYYSNGNMQKDATSYFKIIDNPKMIDGIGVYDNYNKDAKQQEFLVDGELDFSKLSKIDIFCCDEEQCELLKNAVKGSPLVSRISVNSVLYEFTNKQLQFNDSDEEIEISSNYDDSYEFRISYDDEVPILINKENVSRQKEKNIYVNNMVDIRKDVPFRVFFEVSQPRFGSWLIYDNK